MRRLCGAILAGLALLVWNPAATWAQTDEAPRSVLFIGMTGMTPGDLDLNSGLGDYLQGFSWAALSPRSFSPYVCATEGWLGLRTSGDVYDVEGRALGFQMGAQCLGMSPEKVSTPATTVDLSPKTISYQQFKARTGDYKWLQTPLFAANTWAVGRNAGLPIVTPQGKAAHWVALPTVAQLEQRRSTLPESLYRAPTGDSRLNFQETPAKIPALRQADKLQADWSAILSHAPGDVIADLDAVDSATLSRYDVQAARVALHQQLLAVLKANAAQAHPRPVIIASLGDVRTSRSLQLLVTNVVPPAGKAGVLYSSATRTEGLTTTTDLKTLIVKAHHAKPADTAASAEVPLTLLESRPVASQAAALEAARAQQLHADVALATNANWYNVFHVLTILAVVLCVLWLFGVRYRPRLGRHWGKIGALALFAFAMIPAAQMLNLFSWWSLPAAATAPTNLLIALGLTALFALIFTVGAWRDKHPVSLLALVSLAVLSLDIITGSAGQRNGFMGSLVLSSRRYYGVSNRTYDLLLVTAFLVLIPIITRFAAKKAAVITALIGVAVLLVDALPSFGADFGGPPGIILAFLTVTLLVARVRLRWWHALVWVVLTLAVMGGIGLFAHDKNSHIGAFWSNLGTSANQDLIAGKVRDVLRSFASHLGVLALLLVAIIVLIVVLIKLRRSRLQIPDWLKYIDSVTKPPALRLALLGIALGVLVAVPINDSGAMMIEEALYMVLPAAVAIICFERRAANSSQTPDPETALVTSGTDK